MKIARLSILLIVSAFGLCAAATLSLQARQTGTQPAQPRQTPTPAQEDLQETTTTRAVRVPVTVLDKKGQPVTGLTRDSFLVFEDKRPIVAFDFLGESQEIEKQPIFIGVLMDTSG